MAKNYKSIVDILEEVQRVSDTEIQDSADTEGSDDGDSAEEEMFYRKMDPVYE